MKSRLNHMLDNYRKTDMSYQLRMDRLKRLEKAIRNHEEDLNDAIYKDLNKSEAEFYISELSIVYKEIDYFKKNLRKLMKLKRVGPFIGHPFSKNYTMRDPLGLVLIIAPWNYPVQLSLNPLVGALAGGNICLLKVSKKSVYSSQVLGKIIDEAFDETEVIMVVDDYSYDEVLDFNYDLIFFTLSSKVGKTIMASAAQTLTPVILELGGKSPALIDSTADLALAAKRVVFGKGLNSGQTCIAPDYLYIEEDLLEDFIELFKKEVELQYGRAIANIDYAKIISPREFDRLLDLMDGSLIGGEYDKKLRKIEPSLVLDVKEDDRIMEEEIFGPLLPVISYKNKYDLLERLRKKKSPLAFYIFSQDRIFIDKALKEISFGGGCVNDTIMHIANDKLPFGGVGNSGMGNYHGAYSFNSFTRQKAIVETKNPDLSLRYAPYTDKKMSWLKKIL